eukprot:UN22738
MCYLKLKSYSKAETDCSDCLNLDGSYLKAYFRRAQARQGLKKWTLALEDFKQVIALDSEHTAAKNRLHFVKIK